MRIKHTSTEVYKVFNYFPMSGTFKGCKRWFFCKSFATKQGAMNFIKRNTTMYNHKMLLWRIDWTPSPYSSEFITVYDESEG